MGLIIDFKIIPIGVAASVGVAADEAVVLRGLYADGQVQVATLEACVELNLRLGACLLAVYRANAG